MYVRCVHCGYDNSPEYRFCGMCGSALAHQTVATKPSLREGAASAELPAAERPLTAERTSAERPSTNGGHPENVHGPSFLGLADDPKEEFRYLYEDEPPRSYTLLVVIVLLLAALGGAGYWQWRHDGFPFNRLTAASKPAPVIAPPAAPATQSPGPQTNAPGPATNAGNAAATPGEQNSSAPDAANTPESPTPNAQSTTSSEAPAATANPPVPIPQESAPAKTEEAKPKRAAATKVPKRHSRAPEPKPAEPTAAEAPSIPVAPDADLELAGERYLYGNGLPQNCDRAETALRASADHGNSKAQTVLGTMYATGHCVGRDLPLAYRWFARALHQEPQNTRIAEDLQVLWRQMTPQEKQLATASGQ